MTARFACLSPYLMPASLMGRKVVNIGDGFILRAIERLIGSFAPSDVFTCREPPSPAARATLEASQAVILAGANQLHDRFTVWPGMNAEDLRTSRARFVPMGIGIHGVDGFNDGMTEHARAQIEAIHERIPYSSWRCPRTVAYLERWVPSLRGRFLMTGCPVIYGERLLEGCPFHDGHRVVAVTATERGKFWEREIATLEFVARRHSRARRLLVLHQDFLALKPTDGGGPGGIEEKGPQALRRRARDLGYDVIVPASADAAMDLYEEVDMHYGSRLHAHLLLLSRARRSWLIPVDGRAVGVAQALGFPLCRPEALAAHETFDFEIVRARAREHFATMTTFVRSLGQ